MENENGLGRHLRGFMEQFMEGSFKHKSHLTSVVLCAYPNT